ncbi:hypothetical protein [Lactobacillus intestinalis]|nr:hypothetical protein [Lactobacillus intestinalis]
MSRIEYQRMLKQRKRDKSIKRLSLYLDLIIAVLTIIQLLVSLAR